MILPNPGCYKSQREPTSEEDIWREGNWTWKAPEIEKNFHPSTSTNNWRQKSLLGENFTFHGKIMIL